MKPEEFVTIVTNGYEKYEGIFSSHKNAEDLAPSGTDLFRALFLFYVTQLDYATKSQRLYEGARSLVKDIPVFFTPNNILSIPEQRLSEILKSHLHPRYINEAVRRYTINSKVLLDKYEGNPLNILMNTELVKDVERRIKEFRGFGPKIGNFFIRTMINTFNFKYVDVNEMLPPVDVHDVRIAYLMGFVDSDTMSQKNIMTTKILWSTACKNTNTSWLEFDKALWLLGSEGKPKSKEDILKLLSV